ncbi:hypothetical protein B0T21DRAFT_362291 [Apiosordaria backusii]|uniref:Secreted protein n=1 Tax=Apiosordaria backusii TaxID=314023 RepID=A0AA40BRW9_9PEZI|nr:hypothetical protein B0T21DRAFT_362291 [Apiosordaria backusii]
MFYLFLSISFLHCRCWFRAATSWRAELHRERTVVSSSTVLTAPTERRAASAGSRQALPGNDAPSFATWRGFFKLGRGRRRKASPTKQPCVRLAPPQCPD